MATKSENELIQKYPRKNCWVNGLHKIFASKEDINTCTVVDKYKEFVSEYTVIYVICDASDKSIFGERYREGTKWIIANKTLFQCSTNAIIETTCYELFILREQRNLIPGTKYRVTDYTCQQSDAEFRSLNHRFDIIFTALDEKTLDEWCTVIQNKNDDYFASSDLSGWVIRCVLESPKPILYKTSIEEFPDEVDEEDYYLYDGQFTYDGDTYNKWKKFDTGNDQGWWILTDPSQDLTSASLENPIQPVGSIKDDVGMGEDMYSKAFDDWIVKYVGSTGGPHITVLYMKDENNNECYYDFKNIQFKRYMIKSVNNIALEESILNTYLGIKNGYGYDIDEDDYIWVYTFGGESDGSVTGNCRDNKIGYCGTPNNITMLYGAKDNEFGNCSNVSMGESCYSNKLLDYCNNNTFGNDNGNNTFGNNNHHNTFGNYNWSNTFGNYNYNNTFGNAFQFNTFGNENYNNTFGNGCSRNSFGNDNWYNTFGNDNYNNTFGNNNYNNSFGNYNSYNTFGNGCSENTFGNNNWYNTFGNNNGGNVFGNDFQYNRVDEDVQYLDFTVNYSDPIMHIHILSGYKYGSLTAVPTGIVTSATYCQFIGFDNGGNFVCKNPLN